MSFTTAQVFLVYLTSSGLMKVKCSGNWMGTRQFIILKNKIKSFRANLVFMGSMLSSFRLATYSRSV